MASERKKNGKGPLEPPNGYGEKAARCVVGGRTFLVPLHGGVVHGGTAFGGAPPWTTPPFAGAAVFDMSGGHW